MQATCAVCGGFHRGIDSDTYTYTHTHSHSHTSEHLTIALFIIGLISYIVAQIIKATYPIISNILYVVAIILSGYEIIYEGIIDTIHDSRREGKFKPNVHFLVSLSAVGACIIKEFQEAALLVLIFSGVHFIEEYAEDRSRKDITKLMDLNPTQARLIKEDGRIEIIDVNDLKVGDKCKVLVGDKVPSDAVIVSGLAYLDESSITGESTPVEKTVGDEVFGASVNQNTDFIIEITKTSDETIIASILKMVNQTQNTQTKTQSKIKKFEPKYVTIVLLLLPVIVLMGSFVFSWTWQESLYRGLVFLIAASPCALAASGVSASLSTISNLARNGILVKGSNYLSNLADAQTLILDKTGTITRGKPELVHYEFVKDINENEIKAIISAMEAKSNHPLATAIVDSFGPSKIQLDVQNHVGCGLSANYKGNEYKIGKKTWFEKFDNTLLESIQSCENHGETVVVVAKNDQAIGLLALMDQASDEAKEAISYFKDQGIDVLMLTGDQELTAKAVAKEVGIESVIANVMPADKVQVVKHYKNTSMTVMVGDGVNDAPALVEADLGVAMGRGTDIAIDSSDMVLMKSELTKLAYAHKKAKKMERITWQNIFFSIFVVISLIVLNFIGKSDIALGIILHEGSTLVVILNGLRMLMN